ncbi:MAG: RnfABCDGE type electron transport complex subunit D [Gammaproteobacteria bacterium]|nr:RnfABCDGE type electron transport complex subunit D [Gammaproteobacteria bacterium]
MTLRTTMLWVLAALLPVDAVLLYAYGLDWLLQAVTLILLGQCLDALTQYLRRNAIGADSLIATAVAMNLLAVALPPNLPMYVLIVAALSSIWLARDFFGGLGQNVFNPAMVGYVVCLVSFPDLMSQWPSPDGLSGATPLDHARATKLGFDLAAQPNTHLLALSISALIGGLVLLYRRIIGWHIPVTLLATLGSLALAISPVTPSPLTIAEHLGFGAAVFAAFFIATDPVSAAISTRGRCIYAALLGLLIWSIREFGQYPDSVAFAVLIANSAVPLIDRLLTRGAR